MLKDFKHGANSQFSDALVVVLQTSPLRSDVYL
jgi:hypothetical protein